MPATTRSKSKASPAPVDITSEDDSKLRSADLSSEEESYDNNVEKTSSGSSGDNDATLERAKKQKTKKIRSKKSNSCRVDKGNNKSSYRVAAINTKCSPKKLYNFLHNTLTDEQKSLVYEMGFGGLFDIRITSLNILLALQIVKAYDTDDNVIYAKDRVITVSPEDICMMFGLPDTGISIPSISSKERQQLAEFDGASERMLEAIVMQGSTDERFRRAFILFVLSIFFCPTCYIGPSSSLLSSILDVKNPRAYNWSQYIFNFLVTGIQNFKQRDNNKRSLTGCLFFLNIFYISTKYGGAKGMTEPPLVRYWDEETFSRMIIKERKSLKGILNAGEDEEKYMKNKYLQKRFKNQQDREFMVNILEMAEKFIGSKPELSTPTKQAGQKIIKK